MGLFGGGKGQKKGQKKSKRSGKGAKQEVPTALDVKAAILHAMEENGNGMSFPQWDPSMNQSFLSLGFDELDAAEVLLGTEDILGVQVEGAEDQARSPAQMLEVFCAALGVAVEQAAPKPKGYEADIMKKLGDATHLMRCGKCGKGLKRKGKERCGLHTFNCPSCNAEQYDLGPLPTPDIDMPMGGMLSNVEIPQGDAEIVIKWFCSWCGCTVGNAKQCNRCKCDTTIVPPQYGAVFVAGDEERARNLYVQAAMPMTVQVALIRLLRAEPKVALKSGATKAFAASMMPEEAPPTALTKE